MPNTNITKISPIPYWAYTVLIAVLYVILARAGLMLQFEHTQASPVWPPTGLAIACYMIIGNRAAPGIFLGAFVANIIDFYAKDMGTSTSFMMYLSNNLKSVTVSTLIATGNTLEAFVTCRLFNYFTKPEELLTTLSGLTIWFFSVIGGSIASATIGVAALMVSGTLPDKLIMEVWITWQMGDATGAFILTPFIIFFYKAILAQKTLQFNATGLLSPKALVIFTISILSSLLIFINLGDILFFHSQAYLLLPFLFYMVFNLKLHLVFVNLLVISVFAIYGTTQGLGPFASEQQNDSLITLQAFIAVLSLVAIAINIMLSELLHSQKELDETAEMLALYNERQVNAKEQKRN